MKRKFCPCGCGYELQTNARCNEIVCRGVFSMLPIDTQRQARDFMRMTGGIPARTEAQLMEFARTVKRQRPAPAKQGELFAVGRRQLSGRLAGGGK